MEIGYSKDQRRFRDEVREYFEDLMTPRVKEALASVEVAGGSAYRDVIRQIGRDGWLVVSWPEEWGGRGLSRIESYIFFDETQRLGVPIPSLTTNTVGPTLMRHGTDEQRERFLPGIARGDIHFSIGYSEPEAGTDLASLRTRATRDDDEWVVDGQKMWTSLIHHADYVWLAARTDPQAPRHRGISILIVPTDAPGFSWTPVPTLREGFTSATFYDGVRVPAANLVGEENRGWQLMTQQLNAERVGIASAGVVRARLDDVTNWARRTETASGARVLDVPWVRSHLARVHAGAAHLELLNWKLAWSAGEGIEDPASASALKVYGTEFYVEAYRLLMEVLGEDAMLADGSPGAAVADSVEKAMRWSVLATFGGGTNEVQREIIATTGLSLQRAPR
jgi:alkylation response protein AidB-like acyl-CoA dehydrogenase